MGMERLILQNVATMLIGMAICYGRTWYFCRERNENIVGSEYCTTSRDLSSVNHEARGLDSLQLTTPTTSQATNILELTLLKG